MKKLILLFITISSIVNSQISVQGVPYTNATKNVDLNKKVLKNVSQITIGSGTVTSNDSKFKVTDNSGTAFNFDSDPSICTGRLFTPTTNVNGHGFVNCDVFTKTGTISASAQNSFKDKAIFGGTVNYDHHSCFENDFTMNSSGILTNQYGWYDAFHANSGTTTNRYGFFYADGNGSGNITRQYALYVPTISKGTSINGAIYTQSNPSYFGGEVRMFNSSGALGANTSSITFAHGNFPGLVGGSIRGELTQWNAKLKLSISTYNFASRKDIIIIRGDDTNTNTDSTIIQSTKVYFKTADINMNSLPTSSVGLSSGRLYINSGAIMVVP